MKTTKKVNTFCFWIYLAVLAVVILLTGCPQPAGPGNGGNGGGGVVPMHTHSWGPYVGSEATWFDDGVKVASCVAAGCTDPVATNTQTTPAIGNTFKVQFGTAGSWTSAVTDPTKLGFKVSGSNLTWYTGSSSDTTPANSTFSSVAGAVSAPFASVSAGLNARATNAFLDFGTSGNSGKFLYQATAPYYNVAALYKLNLTKIIDSVVSDCTISYTKAGSNDFYLNFVVVFATPTGDFGYMKEYISPSILSSAGSTTLSAITGISSANIKEMVTAGYDIYVIVRGATSNSITSGFNNSTDAFMWSYRNVVKITDASKWN